MKKMWILVFAALCALAGTASALAEDGHDEHHEGAHSFHPNLVGVFTGVTSESRRDGSFTLGFEYHRRFSENFGIGVVAEHVFADHEFNVVAIPFSWYFGHWKVYAAPGFEKSDDHGNEFLARFGVEYAIPVGKIEIAPQVILDLVDGQEVFVFGVTFGKGF